MRLVLAALFIFVSVFAFAGFALSRLPSQQLRWWSAPAIGGVFIGATFLSLVLFNRPGLRPALPWKSLEERMDDLRRRNLLISETFEARRAFGVAEAEDEGLHYFLDLGGGRTLYLGGQYLYDFEPISDDPDLNQPRLFPCTQFTIFRHKEERFVLDIQCLGDALEPELIAPPFNQKDWKQGIPDDGEILTEETYDTIKAQRLG